MVDSMHVRQATWDEKMLVFLITVIKISVSSNLDPETGFALFGA